MGVKLGVQVSPREDRRKTKIVKTIIRFSRRLILPYRWGFESFQKNESLRICTTFSPYKGSLQMVKKVIFAAGRMGSSLKIGKGANQRLAPCSRATLCTPLCRCNAIAP